MTIANYLTFMRILISPLFLLIYLGYDMMGIRFVTLPYILLGLLGISELSDALDGYIARRRNEVTDLGKIMDPLADSIYHISLFLTFTLPPIQIPMIFVFILMYRDSMVTTLRTLCALKGYALAARTSGKVKTALQGASAFVIIALLIPYSRGVMSLDTLQFASLLIVCVTSIYTLFSGLDYLIANRAYIRHFLRTTSQ